ncbi:MAG: hypothetical protein IJS71_01775 [Clostridia bacterium]|nr:hypothetical protein [Clostridia bacterium]
MTNSILTTNLIYGAVFVLSGIVIDLSLQRAKMTVARKLFKILFFVVLVYLPFYFGGSLLTGVLTTPFLFFKSISLISVAVAAIVTFVYGGPYNGDVYVNDPLFFASVLIT